jgi:catechol 2,3-dioxygenase-like lactoylglutathione lyase family enzyme
MKARSFSHVGITVSDFNKAVRFYWDVFGCPLVGVADTPPERVRTFFGVESDAPQCKIGWIRVPGGGVLEIFAFLGQPERSPRGHSFFFAKDFDGNLIELMDLGYMYYVLQWLGPLGGWLFRRGMYKRYYS